MPQLKKKPRKMVRFSDYFQLNKTQVELDFVDIPLDTDITLFVDPYALSIESDLWFKECSNLVVDYFQRIINSIRANDSVKAKKLLSNLREPNDTHLGFSSGKPSGRGVGLIQAQDLYDKLSQSKAVRTGKLHDLEDCELLIPNISSDKISDITINIIRSKLIEYTEAQCELLNIPTSKVASGMYWDIEKEMWVNRYAQLPVYNEKRIILVPKAAVRLRLAVDHKTYYQHYVLNFLQAEHIEAGSGLVHVLKNGKRKVHKKDLSKRYPLSKDFLLEFSNQHPEVLERYRASLPSRPQSPRNEEIESRQPEPREVDVSKLIDDLVKIDTGNPSADDYHMFILGALETIFYPALRNPKKEQRLHQGLKRVDITFNNGSERGFFFDLITKHKVHCPYVFFECKNYSVDLENPEYDQLTGRFSKKRGQFGVLVCRTIEDQQKLNASLKAIVNDGRGFVIVLTDADIVTLLRLRADRNLRGIDDHLDNLFRQLVM